MSKRKLTVWVLRQLEGTVSTVLKPFSKARSLETYSNRGYLLCGTLLGLVTWVFWAFLNRPLAIFPSIIRDLMNYLLKPIGFTFPEAFPIALIIWTLYVFVAGKKS